MSSILILNLKTEYFNDVKSGNKKFEYRIVKPYWDKRLKKEYASIEVRLGYPKSDDVDRILKFNWNGFVKIKLTHKEFGKDPVDVYAISLEKPIK